MFLQFFLFWGWEGGGSNWGVVGGFVFFLVFAMELELAKKALVNRS